MRYVFADCELDTQLCAVRRGTTHHPLRPKPFQVLRYLLEHRHRVVPKQELAEQLWPDQYIRNTVIENSILAARRAIGDSGRAQRIIRTLHGHGYRVVVPVTTADDTEAPVPLAEELAPPAEGMLAPQGVEEVAVARGQDTSTAPPLEASRRQLTVLFCDLVGSTRLSRQVDPEEYVEILQAYHAACAAVIERFAGHIAQYLGDRLLVYFGYPQAHEDDAQRAMHAALGIQEALSQLNDRLLATHRVQVAVRMGIHTGLVVVSAMGPGGHAAPLALGETPNMAAQLQQLAVPQTIVVSADTVRLARGYFTFQELGAHPLKEMTAPLPVYQLLGASAAESRLDVVGPSGVTPLVGRDAEV